MLLEGISRPRFWIYDLRPPEKTSGQCERSDERSPRNAVEGYVDVKFTILDNPILRLRRKTCGSAQDGETYYLRFRLHPTANKHDDRADNEHTDHSCCNFA